jgi:hypothetical protein
LQVVVLNGVIHGALILADELVPFKFHEFAGEAVCRGLLNTGLPPSSWGLVCVVLAMS